ncbi:MAG: DUF2271 domain-containing protein [Venatoribacter sp.]
MKLNKYLVGAAMLVALSAQAGELTLNVEIPQLSVAEYHKPYLAIWIEDSNNKVVDNLAVLYDIKLRNKEGEDWLKDMRQWWRKSGRSLQLPIDGVTGATKGPGTHQFTYHLPEGLAAGSYKVRVEAAREVGGRELLNLDFSLPLTSELTTQAQGSNELGKIELTLKP